MLKNAGLLAPAYELVHNVPPAVEAAIRIGFPVIVKPVVGSGSTGVRLCLDGRDVGEQVPHLLWSGGEGTARDILIEEFIVGFGIFRRDSWRCRARHHQEACHRPATALAST
ncbi:hypothetical protein [Neorhizobium galegae]|uniref:ATP-binding protein n=1 Tax=Neorhizobium galegae TaxID=399 RepID=UPI000A9124ED|nr:hypothetical protein [Neorhizobium galegae]